MIVSIKKLVEEVACGEQVVVQGWVKNKRMSKRVAFITLQDGSLFRSLQVVANPADFVHILKQITVGTSLSIKGKIVSSSGREQQKELMAIAMEVIGEASGKYPLQPKHHSMEFLRSIQHLRFRTNTFSAVFRVRHALSYAIHTFFHEHGFYWLHTPVITSVDAEGAGEVFGVTSALNGKMSKEDFFEKEVSLTVSGQLAAEAGIMALGKVYTFGPTFRAENSNTTRHLAEFWMVEPEMAFYDLSATIELATSSIRHIIAYVLEHCEEELAFLEQRMRKSSCQGSQHSTVPLRSYLKRMIEKEFVQTTYTNAVDILIEAAEATPALFVHKIAWGDDLQKEHEQYLTEHFGGAVFVTDYPKGIKAFYMRQNSDGKTVAAMDLLFPRIGEVAGGSQREERLPKLETAITAMGLDAASMSWYLDTRRFGTVPHSGFGIGFERLMLLVTGMDNIRDVIPFPRTPGHAMC